MATEFNAIQAAINAAASRIRFGLFIESLYDAKRRLIISMARKLIGNKYWLGGEGKDLGDPGIDCSGLVGRAYLAAGIELPRQAEDIITRGKKAPLNDLKAGDIVYNLGPAHVGIFDGWGGVIHSTRQYRGAVQDTLANWKKQGWLKGARRILPS